MNRYIFTLDAITKNGKLSKDDKQQLARFIKHNHSYIASSQNYATIAAILGNLVNDFDFVFADSGNCVYKQSELYKYEDWIITDLMSAWLCKNIPYSYSIVSSSGNVKLIFDIYLDDINKKEICYKFNSRFPRYIAAITSDSIIITKAGKDKSQIAEHFSSEDNLVLFSKTAYPDGQDFTLATKTLENKGTVYSIQDPAETYDIITYLEHAV